MPTDLITDADAMARALTLAERGWGRVHPNPLVGAVVVRDGRIIGEGWHAAFGERHAEPLVIEAAGEPSRGATLFVTLEPCAHLGKQPPCVDAILAAGISRVVVAMLDPNPAATGGVERLRSAGVTVDVGLGGESARRLNARFLQRFSGAARPFVALKLAVSLDGKIADARGRSKWLSGPEARAWVHHLRAGFGAIGLGGASLVADNAVLTVRGEVAPSTLPIRVIFDRSGQAGSDLGIFDSARDVPLILVMNALAAAQRRADVEARGATVLVAETLPEALAELGVSGVDSLLVEGGGRLAGALLAAGLLDRIYQVQAPLLLGDGRPAWPGLGPLSIGAAIRWRTVDRRPLGEDTLLVLER